MCELILLTRLRDSITKLMGLFQHPNFYVELIDTGELERDVTGKLVRKLELGNRCPDEEQAAEWREKVSEAHRNLESNLFSARSCVETKQAKFLVGRCESTLKAFKENTMPRLTEIASSNTLYDFIEGFRQRKREVEIYLNSYVRKEDASTNSSNQITNQISMKNAGDKNTAFLDSHLKRIETEAEKRRLQIEEAKRENREFTIPWNNAWESIDASVVKLVSVPDDTVAKRIMEESIRTIVRLCRGSYLEDDIRSAFAICRRMAENDPTGKSFHQCDISDAAAILAIFDAALDDESQIAHLIIQLRVTHTFAGDHARSRIEQAKSYIRGESLENAQVGTQESIDAQYTNQHSKDDADLIDRLLSGPADILLRPEELDFLEAYVKRPLSIAQIQKEKKRLNGSSETQENRNKLKLIRDFNRNRERREPSTSTVPSISPDTASSVDAAEVEPPKETIEQLENRIPPLDKNNGPNG